MISSDSNSRMAKTIAVTGATGAQGGAVARVLLEAGWNVRAITRNTDSDAAKTLKSQGAEVVQASFDDERGLTKAFEVQARALPIQENTNIPYREHKQSSR